MIKRLAMLATMATLLTGCPDTPVNNNLTATPTPTSTPTPTPWLTQEPICTGAITRAQWLVCDNQALNALNRRLAAQWEAARMHASTEQMYLLEDQLNALWSELDLCQDAACVDKAYRRYLDSPPPPPAKPVVKPRPKPKPKPHRGNWGGRGPWNDGLQGCGREIGWDGAVALSRQCSTVSRGANSLCSPARSCATLENLIDKGCRTSRRPPDFCPR